MSRRSSEYNLHIAVARYLDVALPEDATWFHVPNGGSRNVVEAAKLKAMGTKAGVADCIIIWRGRVLAVELKSTTGALAINQRNWRAKFVHAGGSFLVARSIEDVQGALLFWGIPLCAQLMAGGGWAKTEAGT